jgi:hypothetical protein
MGISWGVNKKWENIWMIWWYVGYMIMKLWNYDDWSHIFLKMCRCSDFCILLFNAAVELWLSVSTDSRNMEEHRNLRSWCTSHWIASTENWNQNHPIFDWGKIVPLYFDREKQSFPHIFHSAKPLFPYCFPIFG